MDDLVMQALNAKDNGNISLAKQLLAQALVQDPRNEAAWMMMSEVVGDIKLKRNCLERVVAINPDNVNATLALMKLDTSPLGPVIRGERFKPVVPPKIEKAPPFTPPFTWTGDESQFQALGDMTFPDITGEETTSPGTAPEAPTTFDWAADSGEPDKTIEKIFDAVSNPELASQPPQEADLTWVDKEQAVEEASAVPAEQMPAEATLPPEPAAPVMLHPAEELPAETVEMAVGGEPEMAPDAFTYAEPASIGHVPPEPLLWDNPKALTDRLVILGNTSIIYANPMPSDIPHILGLFKEKKMLRELLGPHAGVIKLDSIQRVTTIPKRSTLDIDYQQNEKTSTHMLEFKNRQERDDVLAALQLRLGADFIRRTISHSFWDKALSPLLCILLVAAIGWLLIGGLPQLTTYPPFQSGVLHAVLLSLQSFTDVVGPVNLLVITLILVVLCLMWLVINFSKPGSLVILERPKAKPKEKTGH